jgi:hypothetical protein
MVALILDVCRIIPFTLHPGLVFDLAVCKQGWHRSDPRTTSSSYINISPKQQYMYDTCSHSTIMLMPVLAASYSYKLQLNRAPLPPCHCTLTCNYTNKDG